MPCLLLAPRTSRCNPRRRRRKGGKLGVIKRTWGELGAMLGRRKDRTVRGDDITHRDQAGWRWLCRCWVTSSPQISRLSLFPHADFQDWRGQPMSVSKYFKFSGTEPEHFRILAVLLSSDFQHLPCSARPSTGLCYGKSGATCWTSMPAQARNRCQDSACLILPCICPPPCL